MNDEEFFRRYAGKYRLVKLVLAGADCSEAYNAGWNDKSLYMFIEIGEDGSFVLKVRSGSKEKRFTYHLDPSEMKYYLTADHSGVGMPITIENGILTDEADDHLMVYELTDELD